MKDQININEQELRDILIEAVKEAYKFDWTGWRIPIYIDEQGEISKGSWLNNSSWQPGIEELPITVETWEIPLLYDDIYDDTSFEYEVEEMVDFKIKQLRNYYDENKEYIIT